MIPVSKLDDIAALVYRDFIEPLMNRISELEEENKRLRDAQGSTNSSQVRDLSEHV